MKKVVEVESPLISVIIPSLKTEEELAPLLKAVGEQTEKSVEIIIVYRVAPSGKARNMGAYASKGEFLVFLDDDIQIGNRDVLRNLIDVLKSDERIGLVGASTLLPPDANRFQRRVGREIPRMMFPVVNELTNSDMVTTQCWAQRRENFLKVGPFSEVIRRGVDPEYRHRVRSRGYRIFIAPNTYTYHPPPINLRLLCRQSYRNGHASALAQRLHPELVVPVPDSGVPVTSENTLFILRVLKSIRVLIYGLGSFRYLGVFERISYAAGYLMGRLEKI